MQLIHRTNYWGEYIESNSNDPDVDFDAIWAMALDDDDRDCCSGFGNRRVPVYNRDFKEEDNGWWSLFLVNSRRGDYNSGHYFYKFVAIPQGIYGYGKRGCQQRGWVYKGEFEASSALQDLDDLLDDYIRKYDDDVNHVHVGLWMDELYAGKG